MEAYGDLVRRIGLVLDPSRRVGEQLSQRQRNPVVRYPDVALAGPELVSTPRIAEHVAVEVPDEGGPAPMPARVMLSCSAH
jgi:hypothetical protein